MVGVVAQGEAKEGTGYIVWCNNVYKFVWGLLGMLTRNLPLRQEDIVESYFVEDLGVDKRCRGENSVIGKIERALGEVCKFSGLSINRREIAERDSSFYKYCFAKMFSNGKLIQLRVRGEYSLEGTSVNDLYLAESFEHQGSFVGRVDLVLRCDEGANWRDMKRVRKVIVDSGLERNRKA